MDFKYKVGDIVYYQRNKVKILGRGKNRSECLYLIQRRDGWDISNINDKKLRKSDPYWSDVEIDEELSIGGNYWWAETKDVDIVEPNNKENILRIIKGEIYEKGTTL